MSCPFNNSASPNDGENLLDPVQGKTYRDFLQLDKLLSAQVMQSELAGNKVHDEHLFIVTHQVYELWFKQIIFELDSIREIFIRPVVDESNMMVVVSRLNRIVQILKILVEQIMILETMTPLDFMEFRGYLSTASGFQSLQFRIIENKFGVKKENRIRYRGQSYSAMFENDSAAMTAIHMSEDEPSLFDLIERWLERTPGLDPKGFNFWGKFKAALGSWTEDQEKEYQAYDDKRLQDLEMEGLQRTKETFHKIIDEEEYNVLRTKGERRLTWRALQGAMMISFYRDEVLFNGPFQILNLLMDIDSLLTKWRHNHVGLVQRQIGTKIGTGGSSGYQYLRATVSDRYKAFLDLFILTTYLIPKRYIPKLDNDMRKRFAEICSLGQTTDCVMSTNAASQTKEANGVS